MKRRMKNLKLRITDIEEVEVWYPTFQYDVFRVKATSKGQAIKMIRDGNLDGVEQNCTMPNASRSDKIIAFVVDKDGNMGEQL